MDRPIEWDHVASLYDTYIQTTMDLPFFLAEARKVGGEVLELTSGTGRVSIPLIEAGVRLTCVDLSGEMLSVLRKKLADRGLSAETHQMDMRQLSLAKQFNLIYIPFHAFAELTSPEDQRQTLARIYAHLVPGGRFICTLHNPPARLKSVDPHLRLWNKSPLADGRGTLLLWGLLEHDPATHIVSGLQLYEEYDAHGVMQNKRMLEIRFHLIEKDSLEALLRSVGFKVAALYGDYAYGEFSGETSPYMIWVLER